MTIETLRRYAVARSLFTPVTLRRAVARLGFVQADPIRAPARAQDLILRHRVPGYRAGDIERLAPTLGIEEDYFVNYGYVTRSLRSLMHPRSGFAPWPRARAKQAAALLEFVRERGSVHPRDADAFFSHGTVRNYWGGQSNATTHMLDALHYRGLLSVAGRGAGIRLYAAAAAWPEPDDPDAALDTIVDTVVKLYAPLPGRTLSGLIARLRSCVPQWRTRLKGALHRAKGRLGRARVGDVDWYWPADENPKRGRLRESVRFLAPFDPVVWDRLRFELFWRWAYRFEAYTPVPKRKLGYYALPLLWRDQVIGWGNLSTSSGSLQAQVGYVTGAAPTDPSFARELEEEMERFRAFLL